MIVSNCFGHFVQENEGSNIPHYKFDLPIYTEFRMHGWQLPLHLQD